MPNVLALGFCCPVLWHHAPRAVSATSLAVQYQSF